ncbi:MAG: SUMF1/EgtB/PvdO family nonheme iron enzyme [Pirellulaceae bacterium]
MIFGPSGCGKSSFVRAGLIPRLAHEIKAYYVDCTNPDLTTSLAAQLEPLTDLDDEHPDLPSVIRNIRQHRDPAVDGKVVLVLDQFEQWLERCPDYSQHDLTEALRHCDSATIQCLILVRDDFWMNMSEFMRCIERKIEEGKNALSLPLFDERHAAKVLTAIGRANQCLPPATESLSRTGKRFVRDAVGSISENGKVLCVRLTILADMVNDRDWTTTNFKKTFGADGVGPAWLQLKLVDNAKVNRAMLPACELVLERLLPAAGAVDIKAAAVRESELKQAAEREHKARFFDVAIEYMRDQIKLVSGARASADQQENGDHEPEYRLTHDFFVTPVRQWLQQRQSTSLAGRTKTRFRELSNQYQVNRSRRYLPNPLEYLLSLMFIRRGSLDAGGRKLMSASHRFYLTTSILSVAALVLLTIGVSSLWKSQNANATIERLFAGDGAAAVQVIGEMKLNPDLYLGQLQEIALTSDSDTQRLRARSALLVLNDLPHEMLLRDLLGSVPDIDSAEVPLLIAVVERHSATSQRLLSDFAEEQHPDDLSLQARLAILQLVAGDFEPVSQLLNQTETPDLRTELVDQCATWHGPADKLHRLLATTDSEDIRFGAVEALAFIDPERIEPDLRKQIELLLFDLLRQEPAPNGAMFNAFENCLKRWEASMNSDDLPQEGPDWQTLVANRDLPVELRLVRITGGTLYRSEGNPDPDPLYTPRDSVPVKTFWISDIEVTVGLFREFVETRNSDVALQNMYTELELWERHDEPMRSVALNDACRFLNWLSDRHHRQPCYRFVAQPQWARVLGYFEQIPGNDGFRLPTVDESEFAARAGSRSARYSWGNSIDDPVVNRYATVDCDEPSASRATFPNRFGIFECLGNVREYTNDTRVDRLGESGVMMGDYTGSARISAAGNNTSGSLRFQFGSATEGFRVALNGGDRP